MILFPDKKRYLIITGSILAIITVLFIVTNIFIGKFIEKKLNTAFTKDNNKLYHLSINKVRTNIFWGSVRFSNIQINSDSTPLFKARKGYSTIPSVFEIHIDQLHFVRFNLIKALLNKKIDIGKIILKHPTITIYKGEKQKSSNTIQSEYFSLDSIPIAGIAGIDLGEIVLSQSNFTFIGLESSDTILSSSMDKIECRGLELHKLSVKSDLFQLDLQDFSVAIKNEQLLLPGGNYRLALKHLGFKNNNGELILKGLNLSPRDTDVYRLAQKLVYTSEIYNIDVGTIQLKNINLFESINNNCFLIDSLKVSELDLSILMDKSLPFNTERRPLLPNQLLKNLKFPIYIGSIQIEKSNLLYQEKMPDFDEPMTVSLNNLNIDIARATSMKDSLRVRKNMTIHLQSDFMKKAKMRIEFVFPLYMEADTFFYAGSLGSAHLKLFNKVTLPALGTRLTDGELESIQFKGSANYSVNAGEMTMLYTNLKAEISGKDFKNTNKFITWAANAALLNSNPGKNGKTRVAQMYTERVAYKGFGNFMWKTLQNGISSTVFPFGEIDKIDSEETKEEQKQERLKNRREKRRKD